jgi:hypothetical protein
MQEQFWTVGRNGADRRKGSPDRPPEESPIAKFSTHDLAAQYIGTDPEGVLRGDYYLDAPEALG